MDGPTVVAMQQVQCTLTVWAQTLAEIFSQLKTCCLCVMMLSLVLQRPGICGVMKWSATRDPLIGKAYMR